MVHSGHTFFLGAPLRNAQCSGGLVLRELWFVVRFVILLDLGAVCSLKARPCMCALGDRLAGGFVTGRFCTHTELLRLIATRKRVIDGWLHRIQPAHLPEFYYREVFPRALQFHSAWFVVVFVICVRHGLGPKEVRLGVTPLSPFFSRHISFPEFRPTTPHLLPTTTPCHPSLIRTRLHCRCASPEPTDTIYEL